MSAMGLKERIYLFFVRFAHYRIVARLKKLFNFRHSDKDDGLVKLNLGCGDKILKHFINVDVVASRAGFEPDVLCDLKKLDFEDNYADEILSVHVIEHFYRWEVEAVLAEWFRVLKPGGKIVLECPNILHAAKMTLVKEKDLDKINGRVKETLWVFYGDPRWVDPYMVHRWGYSPRSLSKLLLDAGFINVRRRASLFKRREPRDMRLEAYKPL
ncbi:MAG TPA: methyltransferase domain-containing protein [Pseudomonadales bacterium]|nr:methyltransferase domain-containing protein [Pseudomonadales bacterium]